MYYRYRPYRTCSAHGSEVAGSERCLEGLKDREPKEKTVVPAVNSHPGIRTASGAGCLGVPPELLSRAPRALEHRQARVGVDGENRK